jgi:hypothetical protein
MRAPDTEPPYPTFSKAQWREIKACLAERGIDLDTTRVGEFVAGEQWWLPEAVAAAPLLLRHALQTMVWLYGIPIRQCPAQHSRRRLPQRYPKRELAIRPPQSSIPIKALPDRSTSSAIWCQPEFGFTWL